MGDSYYDKSGVVRSINSINQKSFSFCFENRFWGLKVMVFFVLLWESWDHLKKFSVVIAILAKFSNHQRLQQFHHFFGLERISFENMIFHLWVLLFPGTSEIIIGHFLFCECSYTWKRFETHDLEQCNTTRYNVWVEDLGGGVSPNFRAHE